MRIAALALCIGLLMVVASKAQTLQTRDCTAANIDFVAQAVDRMPETKQKKTAADELAAARQAMAQDKADDCKDHLLKATLQTK